MKVFTIYLSVVLTTASGWMLNDLDRIVQLLQRRNQDNDDAVSEEASGEEKLTKSQSKENAAIEEDTKPGDSLIQPAPDTLQSSAKYPKVYDRNTAVYGNLKNLGITYGKTKNRVYYTNFRKSNELLRMIMDVLQNLSQRKYSNNKPTPIVLGIYTDGVKKPALEAVDFETRRKKKGKSKYRERIDGDWSSKESKSSETSGDSSDFDKNPGNPYTVHKNKYVANWQWNHKMDGDHMNVNQFAPKFTVNVPSGASLFFGRKWWYYNQDDYKPLN